MGPGVEVLAIGETMLMVTPEDGAPLSADSRCLLAPGGAESNVGMHLAGLGHRVSWASRVGDDPIGRIVRASVADAGVDTAAVETVATARTGVFFKDPGVGGTSVHYYRAHSAASTMGPAFVDRVVPLAPAVVHVSGVTAALSESCRAMLEHLVVDRPFGAALLSFDVNYRPGLWEPEVAAKELLRIARSADVVFVGLDEARTLWGVGSAASLRELIGSSGSLIVKDADRDAMSFTEAGVTRSPAFAVDVVEPVGAGDAFAAGWLSGLLRGLDETRRLVFGHTLAASVLTSVADHGDLPSPADLRAALDIGEDQWAQRVRPARPVRRRDGEPR